MTDVLHDALRDATLAVLLGSASVPMQVAHPDGTTYQGTTTLPSAFAERIQARARNGEFDDLINEAMGKVDSEAIARAIEQNIAAQMIEGLKSTHFFGGRSEPNWLQKQARSIAIEAATTAVQADEALMDTLRTQIGAEVDRSRVGITVNLSSQEAS